MLLRLPRLHLRVRQWAVLRELLLQLNGTTADVTRCRQDSGGRPMAAPAAFHAVPPCADGLANALERYRALRG